MRTLRRLRELARRLRGTLGRRRLEKEMDEELRFHLERLAERNLRAGMSPAEARRRARLTFGNLEGTRERGRDEQRSRHLEMLAQDVRYALRLLRRSPVFTAAAVLTLALGIGPSTAVFSVVDGVLLRPLPYPESERLVAIEALGYKGELLHIQEHARTLRTEAVGWPESFDLTGQGDPERVEGVRVTAGAFHLLGVAAALGRTFAAGEDRAGAEPVVLLAHDFWVRRFGRDRAVLERTLTVDGMERRVLGVLPPGLHHPFAAPEVVLPVAMNPADAIEIWSQTAGTLVARLHHESSVQSATRELASFLPAMRASFPWDMPPDHGSGLTLTPLQEFMVGDARPGLLLLGAAVAMVLLIACVNVASLLLARGAARREEAALRASLGATPARVLRQHLTEALVLAGLGAVAGVALARGLLALLLVWLPAEVRVGAIGIDARVLGVTALASVAAAVAIGVLPALKARAFALRAAVGAGGRGATGSGRGRAGGLLVATELAAATVLLLSAGLVLKGFAGLLATDPGFRTEGVVAATVSPPLYRYPSDAALRALHADLIEAVAALPAAEAVALTDRAPFSGRPGGSVFVIEGRPHPASSGGGWPWADLRGGVSPAYFDLLEIPLVAGRTFSAADGAGTERVAVVSRQLAANYWPDGDALGARFTFPGDTAVTEVVGIVEDVRWEDLTGPTPGALYLSMAQWVSRGPVDLLVATDAAPAALRAPLRAAIHRVDDATTLAGVAPLGSWVGASIREPRFTALLLGAFAAVALLLGAVGVYGVMAQAVGQRRREFGVRMALGASHAGVTGMVLREAGALAVAGVGMGTLAGLAAGRLLAGHLHGVAATDPMVFAAVAGSLGAVALTAAWLPARRAARVEPVLALRGE